MIVNVMATGSAGNLYELIDSSGNSMLIEAGMSRSFYMTHKFARTAPEMCVISHLHSDHSQYRGEFSAMIPVHVSPESIESDSFKVSGFPLKHGEMHCTAFIIESKVDGSLLFFGTDFEFSPDYDLLYNALIERRVENFLIECNYNDFLYHLATPDQRIGCSRHLSDNDVVNFMRIVKPRNPKIITIHGSNRLSGDTYTRNYLMKKFPNATVAVAVGAKDGNQNLFII